MVLKRYASKYKKLARFKQPLWLEKRGKIKKFKREKWGGAKKFYFPKRRKEEFLNQDLSSLSTGDHFDHENILRLKKTYKFLLQDKQRFQFYFGAGRLRFYQLKKVAREAIRTAKIRNLSPGKVFLHLFESRLINLFYRLGFVSSLAQSRRLIAGSRLKVEKTLVKNPGFSLKNNEMISLDPSTALYTLKHYLRLNASFFYFRKKKKRKLVFWEKKKILHSTSLIHQKKKYLEFLRSNFLRLKNSSKPSQIAEIQNFLLLKKKIKS